MSKNPNETTSRTTLLPGEGGEMGALKTTAPLYTPFE